MIISLALILGVAFGGVSPWALFGLLITWIPDVVLVGVCARWDVQVVKKKVVRMTSRERKMDALKIIQWNQEQISKQNAKRADGREIADE